MTIERWQVGIDNIFYKREHHQIKGFAFALRMVKLYEYIADSKRESALSKQLNRSGTPIGAMVREAKHAERKSDFMHKLTIGLKETKEKEYWLKLL